MGSLRDGRWGLPKGRIEADEKSKAAAEREAFEEAGVLGVADPEPLGGFFYFKDPSPQRYMVTVHLLEVHSVARSFPEKTIRNARWFSMAEAVREASQPGLKTLLRKLARRLH